MTSVPLDVDSRILEAIKNQTDKLQFGESNWLMVGSRAEPSISQLFSGRTIAANSYEDAEPDVPWGATGIGIGLSATYNSSATKGVRLEIYYGWPVANYDTDAFREIDHPFGAGETRQKTYIFPVLGVFIRIRVRNLDPSYSVSVDLWSKFI